MLERGDIEQCRCKTTRIIPAVCIRKALLCLGQNLAAVEAQTLTFSVSGNSDGDPAGEVNHITEKGEDDDSDDQLRTPSSRARTASEAHGDLAMRSRVKGRFAPLIILRACSVTRLRFLVCNRVKH